MDIINFKSDLPYPQLELTNNLSEAKLLMPLYAGVASELTAILTYSFQSYVSPKYPNIKRILEGIAVVEMHHHELLGQAIYLLGGYPIMGARNYWNGSMANYTIQPKKYLQENIIAEKVAIQNYERTILNLDNECLKTLLARIIVDEEMHVKIFEDLLKSLDNV